MQLRARDNERSTTPFYPSSPLLSLDHWPILFFFSPRKVLLRHRGMPGTKQSRAFDAIEPRTMGEEGGRGSRGEHCSNVKLTDLSERKPEFAHNWKFRHLFSYQCAHYGTIAIRIKLQLYRLIDALAMYISSIINATECKTMRFNTSHFIKNVSRFALNERERLLHRIQSLWSEILDMCENNFFPFVLEKFSFFFEEKAIIEIPLLTSTNVLAFNYLFIQIRKN